MHVKLLLLDITKTIRVGHIQYKCNTFQIKQDSMLLLWWQFWEAIQGLIITVVHKFHSSLPQACESEKQFCNLGGGIFFFFFFMYTLKSVGTYRPCRWTNVVTFLFLNLLYLISWQSKKIFTVSVTTVSTVILTIAKNHHDNDTSALFTHVIN